MLRIAMLGTWHVHMKDYLKEITKSGRAEAVAIFAERPEEAPALREKYGIRTETDLAALLSRGDIDAVCCCAPTTRHKEMLVAAARAGKHIFAEKALAPTMAECMEIKKEIERAGVTFCISFPFKTRPDVQFARQMIDAGELGRLTMARFRDAHSGVSGGWLPDYWFREEDAAGGAMMDLGCHPMYLLAYLCGTPLRVTGIFSSPLGRPVDENAVAVAEFENGCLGVAETSFDAYSGGDSFELHGTDGTLRSRGGEVQMVSRNTERYVKGFLSPTLPKGKPSPLLQFFDAVETGAPSPEGMGLADALALTELLECAYISNGNNSIVVC